MTRARKFILAVAVAIAFIISALTAYEWHAQGCGWYSLAAALIFYNGATFALWATIDQAIKQ